VKARGFVRHGHNWNRAAGDLRDVVNVQGGAWNQGDWGQFAVNLGKFPSSVYSVSVGVEPPPVVAEFHCPLRTRVGALMPRLDQDQPVDRWWRFDVSSDAQAIGEEVADAILTYGLRFLESVHSLVSIRRILRSHRSRQLPPFFEDVDLAIIEAPLGTLPRRRHSWPSCTRPSVPTRVHTLRVAERLGIVLTNPPDAP
jgi:Domain of unknown function (DUF4304)